MIRIRIHWLAAILGSLFWLEAAAGTLAQPQPITDTSDPRGFVENAGQIEGPARYYAIGKNSAVYFEPGSVVLDRPDPSGRGGVALRVEFPSAIGRPRLETGDRK